MFGNAQVELSTCAWLYPVFLGGKLVGAVDIADIPPECPMLWSKRMMHDWKHVLDFANQQTIVGKFGLSVPFTDGIPILNIFEIPDNLKYEDIPPQFQSLKAILEDMSPSQPSGSQATKTVHHVEPISISPDE